MGIANAQNQGGAGQVERTQAAGQAQGGFQRAQPGQDRPPMAGDMGMMQRMGGGQAVMVADNNFLYILQGNTLYKVNKNNLEVLGQGMLPMPGPRGGFEGQPGGAPGVRSGRAGGGGGETVPGTPGETAQSN
jgi:hypothetical protein